MPEIQDYHYQGSMRDDPRSKFDRMTSKLDSKRVAGLVLTLVVAIMLPVTLIALQQRQNLRQHASEELQEIARIDGQIGKDASGNYYQPALISYNGKLYAFIIGQGKEKCQVPDTNDPNCNRSEWYNVYVTSSDKADSGWLGLQNIGGNGASAPVGIVNGENLQVIIREYDPTSDNVSSRYSQTTASSSQDFVPFPGSWTTAAMPVIQDGSSTTFNGNTYKADTSTGTLRILRKD